MTRKLDARAQRSQKALLRAGMELLNANPDATLSDIASHAGVGRTTLYRQYETRERLINAVAVYALGALNEVTDPIERQATSALDAVRLLFELAMPLTEELQFLMRLDQWGEADPSVAEVSKRHAEEMRELVELGKKEGSIDRTLPTPWVVNLIDGLFIVGWMQLQEGGYTPSQVATLAFTSFCSGVSSS